MNPVIEDMYRQLVNDILAVSSSVPHNIRQKAIVLSGVAQGIKVDFNKYIAIHKDLFFVGPEEYRDIQTLILLDKKIPAIKVYRELADKHQGDSSLPFSKNLVENPKYFNQPGGECSPDRRW